MNKRFLTIKDAAKVLNVNEALVYDLIKNKKIYALKIANKLRINKDDLLIYIKERKLVDLYPIKEASDLLRINKTTLYSLVKRNKIKRVKIGRLYRLASIKGYSLNQIFYTIDEAAQIFKVNHVSIRKLIKDKVISAIKIGSIYRIPEEEIKILTGQKKIKPLLDIKEAQKELNKSRLTVLKYITCGQLAAFKIGKLYRISEEAISRLKKTQKETYLVSTLAKELKISLFLVRRMIKEKKIKAKKIGRAYYINPDSLKELLSVGEPIKNKKEKKITTFKVD